MKYIKIENLGEIEINAFKLIGASTKRDDNTKIGFFGSGLKYTMAFLLNKGIPFHIFSGETPVRLTTRPVEYRGKSFNIILINGEETSMTTEMGPNWETWFALREIYCNAMDEGAYDMSIVDDLDVKAGWTQFYIEINADFQKILDKWEFYFASGRRDILFEDSKPDGDYRLFRGSSRDSLGLVVYRKGIQCYHDNGSPCLFHYDLPWVVINESRTIQNRYEFERTLVNFFYRDASPKIVKMLVDNIAMREIAEFELSLPWNAWSSITIANTSAWLDAIGDRYIVRWELGGWFEEEIKEAPGKFVLLPTTLVEHLISQFGDQIKVMGETINGMAFKKVERTSKHDFLLKEVENFFKECGYTVEYPIEIVEFDRSRILGQAKDGKIYLANKLFDSGRRTIARTIIEETEHLKTGYNDESRSFQDHLLNLYLKEMEEKNAFFL